MTTFDFLLAVFNTLDAALSVTSGVGNGVASPLTPAVPVFLRSAMPQDVPSPCVIVEPLESRMSSTFNRSTTETVRFAVRIHHRKGPDFHSALRFDVAEEIRTALKPSIPVGGKPVGIFESTQRSIPSYEAEGDRALDLLIEFETFLFHE